MPSRPVAPAAWLEWRKEAALELKEDNEEDEAELEELFVEADDIEDALMHGDTLFSQDDFLMEKKKTTRPGEIKRKKKKGDMPASEHAIGEFGA